VLARLERFRSNCGALQGLYCNIGTALNEYHVVYILS
jgi:hypothetical protein